MTLTPTTPVPTGAVVGADAMAEPHPTTSAGDSWSDAAADGIAARVRAGDYARWLTHVRPAAGCTSPVRLVATGAPRVDTTTGEITGTRASSDLPDGVVYKPCGNRRAAVCPHCAEIYRGDAYQLVLAGMAGGKTLPTSVATHPAVFLTLTAPSFGIVHTQRRHKHGRPAPCRPRRDPETCPHGVTMACRHTHGDGDDKLGRPLCLDCYDHTGHVVFNAFASELWRRTTITANRLLAAHAKEHGQAGQIRLSYSKVAEFQRRGLVHFHVIVRLDGLDPGDKTALVPPPRADWVNVFTLAHLLRTAVETTSYTTPDHPHRPGGWTLTWGREVDIRPVATDGSAELAASDVVDELATPRRRILSSSAVAGYIAKYATKATETAGHSSARLNAETVTYYPTGTHIGRLVRACWRLGASVVRDPTVAGDRPAFVRVDEAYRRLRRWAHMLGYGGHFLTKSRRYSTTFRALRQARADWRAAQHKTVDHLDDETSFEHLGQLRYAGNGWLTAADAILAQTSAELARIRRDAARLEMQSLESINERIM